MPRRRVCRSVMPRTATANGSETAANGSRYTSRPPISNREVPRNNAARSPSNAYVSGIAFENACSGAGSTLIGNIATVSAGAVLTGLDFGNTRLGQIGGTVNVVTTASTAPKPLKDWMARYPNYAGELAQWTIDAPVMDWAETQPWICSVSFCSINRDNGAPGKKNGNTRSGIAQDGRCC